jgi:hypothetical protein
MTRLSGGTRQLPNISPSRPATEVTMAAASGATATAHVVSEVDAFASAGNPLLIG